MAFKLSTLRSGTGIMALDASKITSGTLSSDRLPTSGVAAGTYGSASAVPVLTVDANGRVTTVSTQALAPTSASTIMRMAVLEYTTTSQPVTLGVMGSVPINTQPIDEVGITLDLTNRTFTLPAGVYLFDASIGIVGASRARAILVNTTEGTVIKYGTTISAVLSGNTSRIAHRFRLTGPRVLRIDVESNSSDTTLSYNGAFPTQPESFAQVVIYGITDTVTTMATQVCFYAYGSSSGTTNAAGIIPLNVTLQNVGNGYSTSTYRFTAPYAGAYYMYFMLFVVQSSQTNDAHASMYWQSGSVTTLVSHVHAGNDYSSLSGSAILVLGAGDQVYLQNESASPMTLDLRQGHSYFGGYYIGMQAVPTDGLLTTTGSTAMTGVMAFNRPATAVPATGTLGGSGDRVVLRQGANSSSYPYALGTDSASLWYSAPSGAAHTWFIGGAEYGRIDSVGNVGIGTTSPAYKLHVNGDIRGSSINIQNASLTTNANDLQINAGAAAQTITLRPNGSGSATGQAAFGTTSTSLQGGALVLDSTGSLGLGLPAGTTTPATRLDVRSSTANYFRADMNTNTNGSGFTRLQLGAPGNAGAQVGIDFLPLSNRLGGAAAFLRAVDDGLNAAYLSLGTASGGGAGTTTAAEVMRITSAGNVGINTTAPSCKLYVNGDIRGSSIAIQNASLTTNGNDLFVNANSSTIYFRPYANSSTSQMTLDTSGKLNVSGNAYVNNLTTNSVTIGSFGPFKIAYGVTGSGAANFQPFAFGTTFGSTPFVFGTINSSGSAVFSVTFYNVSTTGAYYSKQYNGGTSVATPGESFNWFAIGPP